MMIKERQKYDREFKQKAVEHSFARGNAREIADELGILGSNYTVGEGNTKNTSTIAFPAKGSPR